MISNNGSLRSIIIVNHADGWLAFSPFSKRVAYAKSKNVLASFVESENRKFAHEVVCSPIGSSKSIKRVSLILTKDCPMRCIYCYTHAGEVKTEMPRELALRSIREVAEEGIDTLHVTFFGGEPTLCMETVRACVNLARTLAPNCLFHISTGGVASEHVVDYIAEQGFTVNLSMDGPPDIQNLLRPLPDGKPSAEFAERTIKRLVASGASFKVRATVTELNVTRLSESVEYWGGLGVKFVHFEPINIIGRASRAEMALPDADVYIASFIAALDTAETLGIGLINSAYMNLLNPSPCYCTTVAGDKIIVAPDGAVTLCYEVQECGHQLSDFVIGKYDQETDTFVIDKVKEQKLNSITVDSYKECQDCFAKYVCAGGCPNRNILATGSLTNVNPWVCKVKKALIRDAVIRIYKASKEGRSVSPVAGDLNRSGILPIV